MNIKRVNEKSPFLKSVIRLGDQNKKFLGFFPKKAFERSAAEGLILCALDENNLLCGYLLYYIACGRAVIQQLCVESSYRKKGVGRALVNHLKKTTTHLDGISLHCSRDFPAHGFWPKMDFVAIGEKQGRGKRDTTLTRYWYDHCHPDLFSISEGSTVQDKRIAVLDANVLFDMQDFSGTDREAAALEAPWLYENVDIKITDEIFNEINRQDRGNERKRRRAFAKRFEAVRYNPEDIEGVLASLAEVLSKSKKASDVSDRRQLAKALSAGAEFFVTRDDNICRCAEDIYKNFGIIVTHPTEFILSFDEVLRKTHYQAVRLSGSEIMLRGVGADDIGILSNCFLAYSEGEKKWEFENRIRSALAKPDVGKGRLIENKKEGLLGLFVLCKENEQVFTVPFFRIKKGRLSGTLARNIAMLLIREVVDRESSFSLLLIIEPHIDPYVCEGLRDVGFTKRGKAWIKFNSKGFQSGKQMMSRICEFSKKYGVYRDFLDALTNLIKRCIGGASPEFILRVEQRVWPGKILGLGIRNFIVPIQPRWAIHLFDDALANQDLFGAETRIALSWENVYYRVKVPKILDAPGRILWYVSHNPSYDDTMSMRACSILHEVVVGKAKDVFKRYNSLGVYDWDSVKQTARGDANKEIMAFRFGGTELFRQPIKWKKIQTIIFKHLGTKPPLSTPLKISEKCFANIYELGRG